jgi:hypothetical protein
MLCLNAAVMVQGFSALMTIAARCLKSDFFILISILGCRMMLGFGRPPGS